jgi:hypothetical protein
MDETVVTNEQFAKFVAATGYVTIAKRTPTKEEFPDAPKANLVAGAVVFAPTDHEVPLNNHFQWWTYVKGANWRHPSDPKATSRARRNIRSCKSLIPTHKRTRNERENVYRLKRSSSSRRAAVLSGNLRLGR